jgi:hypothetical protein
VRRIHSRPRRHVASSPALLCSLKSQRAPATLQPWAPWPDSTAALIARFRASGYRPESTQCMAPHDRLVRWPECTGRRFHGRRPLRGCEGAAERRGDFLDSSPRNLQGRTGLSRASIARTAARLLIIMGAASWPTGGLGSTTSGRNRQFGSTAPARANRLTRAPAIAEPRAGARPGDPTGSVAR